MNIDFAKILRKTDNQEPSQIGYYDKHVSVFKYYYSRNIACPLKYFN